MNDAAVLQSAMRELLDKCKDEKTERMKNSTAPLSAEVESHLQAAETALARLVSTADTEECSAIAKEVLSAVAQFRRCMESHEG